MDFGPFRVLIFSLFLEADNVRSQMGKERHELTVEKKNIVLKLLSEDFTHADVGKYVEVSRACITRFLSRYRSRKTVENLPRDDHATKGRNRKLIRVTSSNERLKHKCVDLSNHCVYFLPNLVQNTNATLSTRRNGQILKT